MVQNVSTQDITWNLEYPQLGSNVYAINVTIISQYVFYHMFFRIFCHGRCDADTDVTDLSGGA
jgi:hypothetical protein